MAQLNVPNLFVNGTLTDAGTLNANFDEVERFANIEVLNRAGGALTPLATAPLTFADGQTMPRYGASVTLANNTNLTTTGYVNLTWTTTVWSSGISVVSSTSFSAGSIPAGVYQFTVSYPGDAFLIEDYEFRLRQSISGVITTLATFTNFTRGGRADDAFTFTCIAAVAGTGGTSFAVDCKSLPPNTTTNPPSALTFSMVRLSQ